MPCKKPPEEPGHERLEPNVEGRPRRHRGDHRVLSKKCFEDGSDALQKLLGRQIARQDGPIQIAYTKAAYEGFVAHAAKLGQIYINLASETTKSSENFVLQPPAST